MPSVLLAFVNRQQQHQAATKKNKKGILKLNIRGRFSKIVDSLEQYKSHNDRRKFITRPLQLHERFELGMFSSVNQTIYGDVILNKIMKTLTEFNSGAEPLVLRPDQQIMVSYVLCSFLPLIYKETLEANKDRILRLLRLDKIREELVIMAARRVGKTTCIAVLVAAMMIVIPNSTGAIFSLCLRASKRLMNMIVDMLKRHPKGMEMYIAAPVKNSEQIILVGEHPSHVKILYAFPDRVDVRFIIYYPFLSFKKLILHNCNLFEHGSIRYSSGVSMDMW